MQVTYFKWGEFSNSLDKKADLQAFAAPPQSFDCIVGSDVIFLDTTLKAFAQSIAYLLKTSKSDESEEEKWRNCAILANDVIRYNNLEEQFEGEIAAAGLDIVYRETL